MFHNIVAPTSRTSSGLGRPSPYPRQQKQRLKDLTTMEWEEEGNNHAPESVVTRNEQQSASITDQETNCLFVSQKFGMHLLFVVL